MKIVTIVGARPQFIKAAALSRELRKLHDEVILHTGQHYDNNMSDVFFLELEIPIPKYNLGVGSGTHARQTAEMMIGIEDVILKEKPDALLIYGDTNSTLAGAIVAGKLDIPIAHIEAGARTFVKDMPEEQNRIVADHLAKWNFTASEEHKEYLAAEGVTENVYNVGDVMCDGLLHALKKVKSTDKNIYAKKLDYYIPNCGTIDDYYLSTLHRPENVDDIKKVKSIIDGFEKLDAPVLFAVHPRTIPKIRELTKQKEYCNIHFVKPLGYLDMVFFTSNARKVITDSGGLHKEAFLMRVPSVVVLRSTGWRETLDGNCNVLARPDGDEIVDKVFNTKINYLKYSIMHYGDGTASKKISNILWQ